MNFTNYRNIFFAIIVTYLLAISGCAKVPLASNELDAQMKAFTPLPKDKAGLYVFRNSVVGQALMKNVYIDGQLIGATANKVYFYREIVPGFHTLSTESEFSDNSIDFTAEGGTYYFARQYIKMGVFVGGANLEMVPMEVGMKEVGQCKLAK